MIIKSEKPQGYNPITVTFESRKEVENLLNILDPDVDTSLTEHCEDEGLDVDMLGDFGYKLWCSLKNELEGE